MSKIGIFGGTFDPLHTGHLIVAEAVREAFSLDKIIFIPARLQPFKTRFTPQLPEHRLEMVRLGIAGNPYFETSDIEIQRDEVSYTINTIVELRKILPKNKVDLFFLLGSDNARNFHRWKEPEKLVKLCEFIAFGRPDSQFDIKANDLTSDFHFFNAPLIEISATNIRDRIRKGKSVRYMVPAAVEDYIRKHQLYLK